MKSEIKIKIKRRRGEAQALAHGFQAEPASPTLLTFPNPTYNSLTD